MRISDWISDVCSSDLLSRHGTAHLSLLRVVSGQFTLGKLGRGSGHSRKHWQPASSRQFRPLSFSTLKPGTRHRGTQASSGSYCPPVPCPSLHAVSARSRTSKIKKMNKDRKGVV